MKFTTYIIFSKSLQKHYTGSTGQDFDNRLYQHNLNHKGFTGKANDWMAIFKIEFSTVTEARSMEKKIKKRGAKRFLNNLQLF